MHLGAFLLPHLLFLLPCVSYAQLDHIIQLHYFLARVQKYYLNLSRRSTASHSDQRRREDEEEAASAAARRAGPGSTNAILPLLKMLPKLRDLSDPEREELDRQVQGVIGGLMTGTESLAAVAERDPANERKDAKRRRNAAAAGDRTKGRAFVAALFGDSDEVGGEDADAMRQGDRAVQELRRSVVWTLRKRLMDAFEVQKGMQERVLRSKMQSQDA
ncbi:hypothetical protein HKX48_003347 [Thoreauomyces humboldtii]|nr:hypothetical protein HKX48_003347 [Thoreauomyces humboldtii]